MGIGNTLAPGTVVAATPGRYTGVRLQRQRPFEYHLNGATNPATCFVRYVPLDGAADDRPGDRSYQHRRLLTQHRNDTEEGASRRLFLYCTSRHVLMTRQSRQHGFTLIELVAVLVILGIVAAVAAPRFFDNAVFTERGYADEIAASLRYARRIAIASDCNVRFTVNAAGYSAAQPSVRVQSRGAWGVAVQSPDRRALANATPAGVAVGAAVIEFRPTPAARQSCRTAERRRFAVTVDTPRPAR